MKMTLIFFLGLKRLLVLDIFFAENSDQVRIRVSYIFLCICQYIFLKCQNILPCGHYLIPPPTTTNPPLSMQFKPSGFSKAQAPNTNFSPKVQCILLPIQITNTMKQISGGKTILFLFVPGSLIIANSDLRSFLIKISAF